MIEFVVVERVAHCMSYTKRITSISLIFARLNFRDFRDLKNFAKLVQRIKGAAKIKDAKFSDL